MKSLTLVSVAIAAGVLTAQLGAQETPRPRVGFEVVSVKRHASTQDRVPPRAPVASKDGKLGPQLTISVRTKTTGVNALGV